MFIVFIYVACSLDLEHHPSYDTFLNGKNIKIIWKIKIIYTFDKMLFQQQQIKEFKNLYGYYTTENH